MLGDVGQAAPVTQLVHDEGLKIEQSFNYFWIIPYNFITVQYSV